MTDEELTPSEKKALETLPKERMPTAALEDRVVSALRDRGVLLARGRRVIRLTSLRVAGAVAAAVVLVLGGFTAGFWASSMSAARTPLYTRDLSNISTAATLQQAGTAYLIALEDLAALPDSTHGEEMLQGREVALRTLFTATEQVTRMVPKEYLAGQLLQVIQTSEETDLNHRQKRASHQAIWF